jgi:hypothetical protein
LHIDEIYRGTFAALGILAAVLGITMVAIDSHDAGSEDQKYSASAVLASSETASGWSEESDSEGASYKDLNPEQVLAMRYEQSAKDELQRCLEDGSNSLPPMCDYTMTLLIESCKDPDSYIRACDDERLAEYSAKSDSSGY